MAQNSTHSFTNFASTALEKYRIRIDALGQTLEEQLTIVPDKTTSMSLGVAGDRFVLRR